MSDRIPIGEVAAITGLAASTLRFYEEERLIQPSGRIGGRRHYDPHVIERLLLIRTFQGLGWKLEEIREVLAGAEGDGAAQQHWRALLTRKIAELDALIDGAGIARSALERGLRCDCAVPAECDAIRGFARTHWNDPPLVPTGLTPPESNVTHPVEHLKPT